MIYNTYISDQFYLSLVSSLKASRVSLLRTIKTDKIENKIAKRTKGLYNIAIVLDS